MIAKVAPPAVVVPPAVAKIEPVVEAPRVIAKAEPATRQSPKSDWLVTLPAEEVAGGASEAKPAVAVAKPAAAASPKIYDRTERSLQQREFKEYVMWKAKDPYSNVK